MQSDEKNSPECLGGGVFFQAPDVAYSLQAWVRGVYVFNYLSNHPIHRYGRQDN